MLSGFTSEGDFVTVTVIVVVIGQIHSTQNCRRESQWPQSLGLLKPNDVA
jgi:hypothetical protein